MSGQSAGERGEARLLVLASRPLAVPADIAEIRSLLGEPVDWTALVECTMRHGMTAQVFGRLLEAGPSEVPSDIAEAARTHIEHMRARNREVIVELVEIIDALKAGSIDIIPIKGPVLAHLVYGDATIRSFRDLDFLVRTVDVKRVIAVLHGLGHSPYPEKPPLTARQQAAIDALSGQAVLWRPGAPAAIEPHWTLAPGNLRLALDYEGLWRRSRLIGFAGRQIPGLAPEDLVLVIAVHGGKDEWSKLQAVSDLARAVARFDALDWPVVLGRAERQRCLRMLLTGMRLVERLMGMALPPAVAAACAQDRGGNALADAAADQMLNRGPTSKSIFEVSNFRYRLHDRWGDKLRYVAATLLTPRELHFGLVRLPDRLFFLYYPIKVTHDYVLLTLWLLAKRIGGVGAADRKIRARSVS